MEVEVEVAEGGGRAEGATKGVLGLVHHHRGEYQGRKGCLFLRVCVMHVAEMTESKKR